MEPTKIVKKLAILESDRKSLDTTLQLIEQFVVPFRGEFFGEENSEHEVEWRKRGIYDSTAVEAAQTLAASMGGSLTSSSTRWFGFKFKMAELNDDNEAIEWLQACEDKVYDTLQDSNFEVESSEFYLDLSSFGTGHLIEEVISDDPQKWEGIEFSAVPMNSCYFENDSKNRVLNFYRIYKWTALQIADKWGKDNIPQLIKDKLESNSTDKFECVLCVFKRKFGVEESPDTSMPIQAKKRPYGYKYVLRQSGEELGEEGGYYEMPAFVVPYRKTSGSVWGYSPAFIVLSNILTLNEVVESTLEALGKVIDPATLTTKRGLLSDLDLSRGGLTVVEDIDDIKAYESKARFDVGEVKIDRLQDSINRAFHVDQLQLKDSPAMTATEVQVRYELMQKLLGPTLGRLITNFLDPCVMRTFNILHRADQLPEMPEIVKELEGEIDIEYTGPLARAQKSDKAQSVSVWVERLQAMSETWPEILDLPDMDAIGTDLGNLSGVPAKYIHGETKLKEIRAKRQEDEARAMEAEISRAEGEAGQAQAGAVTAAEQIPEA